jgi:hypothetical protein
MLPPIYIRNDEKELLEVLDKYLPLSLPLIRRLQFMDFAGGKTVDSRILASFEGTSPGSSFVVAYLDYSRGPETEMWLFSSIENPTRLTEEGELGEKQLVALFHMAGEIEDEFNPPRSTPGTVMLGSVHENVLEALRRNNLVERATVPYRKFIFHTNPQQSDIALPSEDFTWGSVRQEDLALVLSRTQIPRKELVSELTSCEVLTVGKENIGLIAKCCNIYHEQ